MLEATAEVTIAVPALSQGEITHCDARALSTYLPLDFEGVRLNVYDVAKLPAPQAI